LSRGHPKGYEFFDRKYVLNKECVYHSIFNYLRKEEQKKKVIGITIVLTLVLVALAAISRGTDSPKGGSVAKDKGFDISVPTFDTKVKQGETQAVTIKLDRGKSFKQDVKLEIKLSKGEGLSVDPAKVTVKASDKPEVQIKVMVPKNAALGEYKVSVTGTPTTGEPASVEFKVQVVAPDVGYTMKSDSPKGGSTLKGEGFKIAVPMFDTKIKQGEVQSVTISLERGESFKQDVTLEIKLFKGEGITFDPAKVIVKAGDKADVQLTITAIKNAALGEYKVSVTGTPTTGESTSVEFNVKVVST
jgi:uncharacterized membrane protein